MEVFHDTKEKHIHTKGYDGASISFIKSKLPLKSSLKLALSNLKLKPFRLFMTVFIIGCILYFVWFIRYDGKI